MILIDYFKLSIGVIILSLTKTGFLKVTLLVLFLGLIVGWLGFGERGFVHLYKMEKEREVYLERIGRLEVEKQSLLDEINRLRTDKEHIESIARREWGLIKNNEILYRFAREEEVPASTLTVENKSRKVQEIKAQGSKHAKPTADKKQ
jgi:cell division protein FtsB